MKKPISKSKFNTKPRNEDHSKARDYLPFSKLMISPLVGDSKFSASPSHCKSTIITNSNNNQKNTTNTTTKNINTSHERNIKKCYKTHKPKCSNVLKIDLGKIDEKLPLDNNEIDGLKKILEKIVLENKGANKKRTSGIKGGKRRFDYLSRTSKGTIHDTSKISGKRIESVKTLKKCRELQNENKPTGKTRNVSLHSSKHLKVDGNDEHYISNNDSSVSHDSSQSRRILRAKPDIYAGKLRIKCVRPICVAQASTHSTRDYSSCALKAHLGEGQCLRLSDPPERRDMAMHYDEDGESEYVIAKGTLTDELVQSFKTLREVRKSLFPDSPSTSVVEDRTRWVKVRQTISDAGTRNRKCSRWLTERDGNEGESARESNPKSLHLPDVDEDHGSRRHWDAESFGTTLRDLERNAPQPDEPSGNPRRQPYIRKSSLDKLKEYIMSTCFWLRFGNHHNIRKKNSDSVLRRKKTLDNKIPFRRVNAKITRTTESDFHCNKSKKKNNQEM